VAGAYVSIYLYNDQQLVSTIASAATNSGSYAYYIPNVGSGSKYHMKIRSATDTMQYDFGSYFTLYSNYYGTYSILSPVDTSVWSAGNTYTVQWQSTGSPGSSVMLQLCNDSVVYLTITSSTSNSGSYAWTVPSTITSGSSYRIKVSSYYDIGIYALSKKFTIAGTKPDSYEPDNQRDSASTLVVGTAQQHTITLGDTDWVKFSADSGSLYIIQDSGAAGFRTYTYLYYGTETSYTNYSYTSTAGTMLWQWTCPRSGTYYAKNFSYYSGYGGAYSFEITKYDPLTSVKFTSPDTATPWAAGSSYTISWTPNAAVFGSYVYLYLYKGNQLVYTIYSGTVNNTGSYSWTIPSGLATGGDYRIKMASYSNLAITGFSSNFTISGLTPDAYEFDNVRDSARALTLGVSQQHNLTYSDTDWVRFSADSGSRYVVSSAGASTIYAYLYLGAATSYTTYFYSSSSAGGMLNNSPWTCASSGTYFMRITPYYSGTTGAYSLKVVKFDSSTAASFSNPVSTTAWSTGSAYSITWSADTALFSNYVTLSLYKGALNLLTIASDVSNAGTYSWTVPAGYLTGTDYRIKISNYSNSSIYAYSQPFTVSGVTPDAFEYDDTAGAAKPITTDGVAQNRTLSRSDIDWVSFTAEKDSLYLIQGLGGTTAYMYEYLYSSPAGSYLATQYGYSPKILWTCPAAGTYYVRLTPYSTSYYGSYQFLIKKYSMTSTVSFINPTTAAAWTTGSSYTIQWVADTALFGATVRLQLTVDTTSQLVIAASATNSGTYAWSPPAGLATGSQYRIKLSNYTYANIAGYSPPFSISGIAPDAYEPDDSSLIAHAIATTGTPESHTITINDKDWYKFAATGNRLYVIASSGAIKPAVSLYSTDAATLLTSANTGYTDTIASIVWFCPVNGSYYFRATSALYGGYQTAVSGYDSTAYRLSVTAPAAGDTVTIGQTKTILWSSTVSVSGYVDIFLYDNTGIVGTIVANAANTGSYSWTVPSAFVAGANYYVRVISRYTSNIFGNSGVFSIK
jgi:hypothetical protein